MKTRSSFRLFVGNYTLTIDGQVVAQRTVDYSRVDFDDGSVEERGRPTAIPKTPDGTSIGELIEHAFAPLPKPLQEPKKRKKQL